MNFRDGFSIEQYTTKALLPIALRMDGMINNIPVPYKVMAKSLQILDNIFLYNRDSLKILESSTSFEDYKLNMKRLNNIREELYKMLGDPSEIMVGVRVAPLRYDLRDKMNEYISLIDQAEEKILQNRSQREDVTYEELMSLIDEPKIKQGGKKRKTRKYKKYKK